MTSPSFITPSPTTASQTQPPQPSHPTPSTNLSSSTLPYTITRTRTRNLPIYEHVKAGGSKHITLIRRISGDLSSLSLHLQEALQIPQKYIDKQGRKKENVTINQLTRQIVVRGWRGAEVKRWCEMVGF
jgi:Mitochondrial large subunit ribosomal protein (Img2)